MIWVSIAAVLGLWEEGLVHTGKQTWVHFGADSSNMISFLCVSERERRFLKLQREADTESLYK